jgi:hypothetical protein
MTNTTRHFTSGVVIALLCLAGRASAQGLPTGWSAVDIGKVGAAGSSSNTGDAFSVSGAGADIWGGADAFQYVYTTLSGDGSIVSRVATVQNVAAWTKAGVMMRETLSAGSRHAFMLVSAGKGLAFQRRVVANGVSTSTAGATGTPPAFVKVTRAGNVITAYQSADGATWTAVGSETIAMSATIYVGLAVSSHVAGTLAAATFDSTAVTAAAVPPTPTTETLVLFRHGEKPAGGFGQITCQGLQRALALPDILTRQFGTPQFLFAPNPLPKVIDPAGSFHYVRPLATIEPTAIKLGLPVNAQYGYADIAALQAELLNSAYASATVFISWEHLQLQQLVQNIMNTYGGGAAVPPWPSDDFDSLYVVRLTNSGGAITAQFEHDFEGLTSLPATCP